jgi:hypothetical protein
MDDTRTHAHGSGACQCGREHESHAKQAKPEKQPDAECCRAGEDKASSVDDCCRNESKRAKKSATEAAAAK